MNRHLILLALLVVGAAMSFAAPEEGSKAERRKQQWAFTPDDKLPNVLILGDSISIGYTLQVRALLEGKANVFRPLKHDGARGGENCSGTTKGVTAIERWLGDRKWDVIHFNFGLHDLKRVTEPGGEKISANPQDPPQATVEKYSENLAVIVRKLKASGARLVFANTTPVPEGSKNPFRDPADPPRYNAAAAKIMQENGVRVNDLFALCQPQLAKIQQPKNVHFNNDGNRALAAQVAKVIEEELNARR
jgi:lysophospholipase L1-like esterase